VTINKKVVEKNMIKEMAISGAVAAMSVAIQIWKGQML